MTLQVRLSLIFSLVLASLQPGTEGLERTGKGLPRVGTARQAY